MSITPEWVQAAALLIAGIAAWRGFGTWRHELVGRRRYELAEETLALFYEAESTIAQMRAGIVDIRDLSLPTSDRKIDPEDPMVKSFQAVDAERRALFARLASLRFRFMATFGPEHEKPFHVFATVDVRVRMAAVRLHELGAALDENSLRLSKKYEVTRYPGLGNRRREKMVASRPSALA
jgi:hypothetical protein